MATSLLTVGSGAQSSSSFTVSGLIDSVHLFSLTGADSIDMETAHATLDIQDDAGGWTAIDKLTKKTKGLGIPAAGTYRVTRLATGASFGVSRG